MSFLIIALLFIMKKNCILTHWLTIIKYPIQMHYQKII